MKLCGVVGMPKRDQVRSWLDNQNFFQRIPKKFCREVNYGPNSKRKNRLDVDGDPSSFFVDFKYSKPTYSKAKHDLQTLGSTRAAQGRR